MKFSSKKISEITIEASAFLKNKTEEIHFYVKGAKVSTFEEQRKQIQSGIQLYLEEEAFPKNSVIFIRLFASDYANQEGELHNLKKQLIEDFSGCAVSVVQQPSLEGRKLVAWVYATKDATKRSVSKTSDEEEGTLIYNRGDYVHIWNTQLISSGDNPDSAYQTNEIFNNFGNCLNSENLNIKDNCIRTWLFVKDIDYNYKGVVDARLKFFEDINMTKNTHFIASTGIDGRAASPYTNVIMDAYSVGGIYPTQIKYLTALNHLNPTHEYGVTFERGTSIDFGDRRHIYISGTASINNKGQVVHGGDVYKQAERTLENISALLADADAQVDDIAQMIVYLRDINDTATVEKYFEDNHQEIPKVMVLAPVCRPGWLIEIECIAIKDISRPEYKNF